MIAGKILIGMGMSCDGGSVDMKIFYFNIKKVYI